MDSKVLVVETSLKRVVLLSIPDLTGIAELQHDYDVRSLPFPLDDMLADDMHGLMKHKTRGHEMEVAIWRITKVCQSTRLVEQGCLQNQL